LVIRHCLLFLLLALLLTPSLARAQSEQVFRLNGTDLTLAEATPDVAVYFRSMRLNRALNVWNVEVTVTNTSQRVLAGPLVLLVDGFTGTTGPQLVDGVIAGGKGFYYVSAISVIPGIDKPRAAKFARELVEKSVLDLLKQDGVRLGNKNSPVDPAKIGNRFKKHFGDPVRKNFKKLIKVYNVCK